MVGGLFEDDSVPPKVDLIAGYGKLGFNTPGTVPCPTAPLRACCDLATEGCTITTEADCGPPNMWHGDWTSCDPNQCPTSGVPEIARNGKEGILGVVPNPSSTSAVLWYRLPKAGPARFEVFDAAGRAVRTLDLGVMTAGTHSFAWDGRDSRGNQTSPGAYFLRLRVGANSWKSAVVRIR